MDKRTGTQGPKPARDASREARLAEALRANLKRRKAQGKARKPAPERQDGAD